MESIPTPGIWGVLLGLVVLVLAAVVAAVIVFAASKRRSAALSAGGIGCVVLPLVLIAAFLIAFSLLGPGAEKSTSLKLSTITAEPTRSPVIAVPVTQARLQVDPDVVRLGDRVSVTGSGWQPGEMVSLEFILPDGSVIPGSKAEADAEGNIDPYDLETEGGAVGICVAEAAGPESGTARASFRVLEGAAPTLTAAPSPSIPSVTTATKPPPTSTRVPPTLTPVPPTPTSPPPPTVAAPASAGCPAPQGDAYFYDDFGNPQSGWAEYRGEDYEHFYKDGEWHFEIWKVNETGNPWILLRDLGDRYRLEVKAWRLEGPEMNNYGLLFGGRDSDNYFAFRISDSGSYRLAKLVDNQWVDLVPWTETTLINNGGVNVVTVTVENKKITACVNGQAVVAYEDPALESGRVGMVAGAYDEPVHIHFDNFGVWKLP